MLETTGNILDVAFVNGNTVVGRCFTSNGVINKNGRAVMGAGVAKVFRDHYKDLDLKLAESIREYGNRSRVITRHGLELIISFPTKHHWRDPSDINLIKESAERLAFYVKHKLDDDEVILLPRPGCMNGGLAWEDVKKVLEPILPDNVVIISLKEK